MRTIFEQTRVLHDTGPWGSTTDERRSHGRGARLLDARKNRRRWSPLGDGVPQVAEAHCPQLGMPLNQIKSHAHSLERLLKLATRIRGHLSHRGPVLSDQTFLWNLDAAVHHLPRVSPKRRYDDLLYGVRSIGYIYVKRRAAGELVSEGAC